MNGTTEQLRLAVARALAARVPKPLRHRVARAIYDYRSERLQGVDLVVPYLDEGLRFLLHTKEFIGWNILFHGSYEPATNSLMRRLVREGDIVLEAGANNGSETVLLARLVGPEGHVHAFEPVPHVACRLRTNIALNDQLDIVTVHECAVGREPGSVVLHLPPSDHANQGLASQFSHDVVDRLLEVPLVSLDTWAATKDLDRLDFLKMDIQGAEVDLLRGSCELRGRTRPVVFAEASSSNGSPKQLFDLLRADDYCVHHVEGELAPLREGALVDGNWVAFPREHSERPR